MQTFVPSENMEECAKVLDRQRLGKQRIETFQILNTLKGITTGWRNHPAVKMWEGSENALVGYGLIICREWISRGYKDGMFVRIQSQEDNTRPTMMPTWWGGPIHASHRSALLRKMPDHYKQFGWSDDPTVPYFWPV